MDDFMELGSIVPLEDGWYLDTESDIRFRINEDGVPVDAKGVPILEQE